MKGPMGGTAKDTMLPGAAPMSPTATGGFVQEGDKDTSVTVTGEYLTAYLKETDGDDSQFKDISASVLPLSTGTSPPRLPPHEAILKAEQKGASPGTATPTGPTDVGGEVAAQTP